MASGLLFKLFGLGLVVRLLAIRDLAFPPWVDSSRHGLITAVMTATGRAIRDYQPFLKSSDSPTITASIPWHRSEHDERCPLTRLLLILGQLLNALIPLTIYAGAYLFTRRRGVSLAAAFLVALPFFFPAYYATWGRFTQLTGMLVMPILLALTWLIVRGARGWRRAWWMACHPGRGLAHDPLSRVPALPAFRRFDLALSPAARCAGCSRRSVWLCSLSARE